MTQTHYDANAVLMGGNNAPAWKFDEPGTARAGIIASPPQARQEREYDRDNPGGGEPKWFPSGDPIMGIVVEVDTNERDPSNTEDTGRRTFYVEGRYIKDAVRGAVRAAGAHGLEVGGHLAVTFTHREDPMDKRSRKFWDVKYTPAGNTALMGDQAQAPAAPVAQQPAPAYQAPAQAPAPQPAAPTPQPAPAPAPQPAPAAGQPSPEALAAFQQWQASQQGGNSHTA